MEAKVNKLRQAYQAVFLAPNGVMPQAQQLVMADLAKFCALATRTVAALAPDGKVDPYATMVMLGRLDVLRRIQGQISVPDSDLIRFAIAQSAPKTPVTDDTIFPDA